MRRQIEWNCATFPAKALNNVSVLTKTATPSKDLNTAVVTLVMTEFRTAYLVTMSVFWKKWQTKLTCRHAKSTGNNAPSYRQSDSLIPTNDSLEVTVVYGECHVIPLCQVSSAICQGRMLGGVVCINMSVLLWTDRHIWQTDLDRLFCIYRLILCICQTDLTDRQIRFIDRLSDRQTDRQTDRVMPMYPPIVWFDDGINIVTKCIQTVDWSWIVHTGPSSGKHRSLWFYHLSADELSSVTHSFAVD